MMAIDSRIGRRWSKQEDDRLRILVESEGECEYNWDAISTSLGNRTAAMCENRWCQVLLPGLRKGPWTEEEDKLIIHAINQVGG